MSNPNPPETTQAPPQTGDRSTPFGSTPNAERYLLEADNLRRRQLRSALLHGSSRTWRDRRRIWPAVIAGIVVIAIVSAAIAVTGAFQNHRRQQLEQQQEREAEQRRLEEERREREAEFDQQGGDDAEGTEEAPAGPGEGGEEALEGQAITDIQVDLPWQRLLRLLG